MKREVKKSINDLILYIFPIRYLLMYKSYIIRIPNRLEFWKLKSNTFTGHGLSDAAVNY